MADLTSARTVPVTVIGERVVIGWDRGGFAEAVSALGTA